MVIKVTTEVVMVDIAMEVIVEDIKVIKDIMAIKDIIAIKDIKDIRAITKGTKGIKGAIILDTKVTTTTTTTTTIMAIIIRMHVYYLKRIIMKCVMSQRVFLYK